jgi:NAD(P)-dependent dehydrogenase (short-subunit alcohol dehydrogenase family)
MKLEGKVALITGGGTGIGAAIAERFVSEGARVCITGRRQDALDETARTLPEGKVVACAGDVSKDEDAERMVATTLAFGGKLDVLINNAAINIKGSITDIDSAAWRSILEVNLTGPFLLMRLSMPHLIKSGAGSIINVSSLGGIRCNAMSPAYDASKAGLIQLTQQVAMEYGKHGVRCNVVCPGHVRTPLSERSLGRNAQQLGISRDEMMKIATEGIPLGRSADPSELAGICVFLASDDASFMTGAVLVADGGVAVVDASRLAVTRALAEKGII